MDVRALTEDQEREVQDLMADFGIDRFAALAALGLLPGDILGDGDLYRIRPLTDLERRLLGLEGDIDHAARAEPRSRSTVENGERSDGLVAQRARRAGDD
jgi:hypothetical protein